MKKLLCALLELLNMLLYTLSEYQLSVYKITKKSRHEQREPVHGLTLADAKCLVLAPHPDDELIACGGTLCMYPKNFDVLCLATSGMQRENQTPAHNSNVRYEDFCTIMTQIGIQRFFIFEYFASRYCHTFYKNMINIYMRYIDVSVYDYIFLPHINDNHPDHQYVLPLLKQMISKQGYKDTLKLAFYEVWSPLRQVNAYVNIENVIMKKRRYLSRYRTVGRGYVEPVTGLNRYRGLIHTYTQCAFVECFEVVDFKQVEHAASF